MAHDDYFRRLRWLLQQPGIPTQLEIARALNEDQPWVSRVMNGDVKRIRPRVKALRRYAFMRVRASRKAMQGEVEHKQNFALSACREYLVDGFDPGVLMDQVAILRRAQRSQSV